MGFIGDIFSSDKGAGYQASGAGQRNANGAVNTSQMQNRDYIGWQNAQQNNINQGMGLSLNGMNQQQQFINALGTQARGGGPNPALAQLNATTGQNVQNQAALMASQRGVGGNVGLVGRQAARQGSEIQQQAAGQAAVQAAQQQLAAQQLQGTALQNYNQNAQGYQGLAQNQQQALLNAQAQQNASNVAMQSNINNANAGIANTNTQGQQGIVGGILGGIGSIFGLAEGGMVPDENEIKGSDIPPDSKTDTANLQKDSGGPASFTAKWLNETTPPAPVQTPQVQAPAAPAQAQAPTNQGPSPTPPTDVGHAPQGGMGGNPGADAMKAGMSKMITGPMDKMKGMSGGMGGGGGDSGGGGGGMQDMMKMLPMLAMAANKGGQVPKTLSPGGKVDGQAKVKGDSLKNDTVKAMLSPGEIVIPRTVVQGDDPVGASAKFVQAILAKERMKGRK